METEEGGWQVSSSNKVNFKDVETMKRILQECFCTQILQYENEVLPSFADNETDYSDYEGGGWGQEEEQKEQEGIAHNYTGSQLCSMWRTWDTGAASASAGSIDVRAFFVISLLGLVGNATSLVVLLVIGMQSSSGRIKRVARHGLMALALSDALVCTTALPVGIVDHFPISTSFDFSTVYAAYGEALMSIFITSSTWITVTMSAGRYFAICSPFRARNAIRDSNAKRCVVAIGVFSLLTNVPRFWWMSIESFDCAGHLFYFRWFGVLGLENDTAVGKIYFWLYSVLVIFLPLVLLLISSACLVRKLRQSTSIRFDAGSGLASTSSSSSSSQCISSRDFQITVTLITIATIHVLLVSPAEVLSFLRIADRSGLQSVFNTMQVTNFTLNFLLYAVLNSSFRRTLLDLLRCRLVRWRLVKRRSGGGGGVGGARGLHCHPLLNLQSYVNVPEPGNKNTTLPVDDVINTCL